MTQSGTMHTQKPSVARELSVGRELAVLLPPAALLALMLVLAARGDSRAPELLLAVAAVLVFHVAPGLLLWRSVRPADGWLVEDLAMGFALGAAMAVPTQVLTVATGLDFLPFALPLLLMALLLGIPATRARITSRRSLPLPWWWGSAVAACLLYPVLTFISALAFPIRWSGFAERLVDLPFHEALVGELLHRFPLHYPHLAQEEVAYHWFGHAWTANIVALSGTPIDVALWRVDPALIHVAAPLLTAVVAMRISGRHWAGPLAAAVAFLAPAVEPWELTEPIGPFSVASPTQGFGVLLLPAVIGILALRWRGELGRGSLPLLAFMMVIAGGAKGTTLAILVPGLLLATLAMLVFDRARVRQVALDAALAIVVLVGLTKTIFNGGGEALSVQLLGDLVDRTSLQLQVGDTSPWSAVGAAVVTVVLLKYGLVALGLLAALVSWAGRLDPLLWALLGCALAGVGALVVFSHPGAAQYYFFKTSLVPLGIGAACGIAMLARSARRPSAAALTGAAAGAAAVAAALTLAHVMAGDGPTLGSAAASLAVVLLVAAVVALVVWRRLGRATAALAASVAMVVAAALPPAVATLDRPKDERTVSKERVSATWLPASDVRAYRWLRDHSDPDDLVATNQHCAGRHRPNCSRRAFNIAGYSERRVLIEGWAYVPRAGQLYDEDKGITSTRIPYWDPELLALNDGFFENPDAEGAERLRELGVRWLVSVDLAPHAETLEPYAVKRYSSRFVDIYELPADEG